MLPMMLLLVVISSTYQGCSAFRALRVNIVDTNVHESYRQRHEKNRRIYTNSVMSHFDRRWHHQTACLSPSPVQWERLGLPSVPSVLHFHVPQKQEWINRAQQPKQVRLKHKQDTNLHFYSIICCHSRSGIRGVDAAAITEWRQTPIQTNVQ